jgi:hypothetical protein
MHDRKLPLSRRVSTAKSRYLDLDSRSSILKSGRSNWMTRGRCSKEGWLSNRDQLPLRENAASDSLHVAHLIRSRGINVERIRPKSLGLKVPICGPGERSVGS